ncbi:unnamed protein product [Ostreobium quekettii]|uniref:Right handed beta helix domain-containing protein n=1 Tax=Ostreobium quekettii TaxID=121088 RepID=A0A8S1IW64_9CHLO|nr:unnamed protein product [Ostreobium quekettii]|eukprot:evm.model.scf_177.6 EVM.evm.TU.scf_177.6   scf_177:72277-90596(+)
MTGGGGGAAQGRPGGGAWAAIVLLATWLHAASGQSLDCQNFLEAGSDAPQIVVTNETLQLANNDLQSLINCVPGGTLTLDIPEVSASDTLLLGSPVAIRSAPGRREKVKLGCQEEGKRVLDIKTGGVEISGLSISGCTASKIIKISDCQDGGASISDSEFASNGAPREDGVIDVEGRCLLILNTSTIVNNTGGGLALAGGVSAVVTRCTFDGNTRGGSTGGAAISAKGEATQLEADNVVFINNAADKTGGAVELDDGASGTIRHCIFANNSAQTFGGAVAALENTAKSELDFENTTFVNNRAEDGGAIFLQGINLSSTIGGGCIFTANAADRFGGAISGDTNGDLTVDGASFANNSANNTGGAVYLLGAFEAHVVRFTNTIFEENESLSGGAIYVEGPESLVELDSGVIFTRNAALAGGKEVGGGAVALTNVGRSLINGVEFNSNLAEELPGGAMVVEASKPSEVELIQCTFLENAVEGHRRIANGGGLHLEGRSLSITIRDSVFESNKVDRDGGGIAVNEVGTLEVDSVLISGNVAGMLGGGMVVEAVTEGGNGVILTSVNFTGNTAGGDEVETNLRSDCRELLAGIGTGGGLAMEGDYVNCSIRGGSVFSQNSAIDGGALSLTRGHMVNLEDVQFFENVAVSGGAMHLAVFEGTKGISGSRLDFTKNSGCQGAAVSIVSEDRSVPGAPDLPQNSAQQSVPEFVVSFVDAAFTMNSIKAGGSGGGGLFVDHVGVECTNCSFVKNTCNSRGALGGGAMVLLDSSLNVIDSRFEGNEAGEGGAVHCEGFFLGQSSQFLANRALRNGGALRGVERLVETEDGMGLNAVMLMDLTDCNVTENTAADRGGGAFVAPSDVGIGMLEGPRDSELVTPSQVLMALRNSQFLGNNAGMSGGALFSHLPDAFEINCVPNDSEPLTFRSLDVFQPELCGWTNNTVAESGYGPVMATIPVSAKLVPDRIEGHSSGKMLETVVVTVVDAVGQTVNSRDTLVGVTADERFGALVFGQRAAETEAGRANFSATFLTALPGSYEVNFSFPGIMAPMVLPVEVRNCVVGEVERLEERTCKVCETNLFSFNPLEEECQPCSEANAFCNGSTITPLKGYWHSTSRSVQIIECLHFEPCDYRNRTEILASLAAEAHASNKTLMGDDYPLCAPGYKGVLCGACDVGYGRRSSGTCSECQSRRNSAILIAFASIWSTLLIAFFVRSVLLDSQRYDHLLKKKLAEERLAQHVAAHAPPVESLEGPMEERIAGASMPHSDEIDELPSTRPLAEDEGGDVRQGEERLSSRQPRPKRNLAGMPPKYRKTLAGIDHNYIRENRAPEIFKIALNFLQQVSIALAINLEWTDAIQRMLETLDFAGGFSNASAFFSMDCALAPSSTPKSIRRMLINLSFPFMLVTFCTIFWLTIALLKPASRRVLKRRIIVTVWGVLYVSYFEITSRLIRTAYCVNADDRAIADAPDSIAFDSYWSEDTDVKCWEGDHLALFVGFALPLFLLIPIGVPVWLISFLWLNRKRFDDLRFLGTYGELYKAFRARHVYWEAVIMLRKALLSVVVVWRTPLGGELQGVLAVSILVVSCFAHLVFKPYSEALYGLNEYETVALGVSLQIYLSGLIVNSDGTNDVARVIVSVLAVLSVTVLLAGFLCELIRESRNYLDFLLDERELLNEAGDAGVTQKVGILGKYYVDKSKEAVGQSLARVSSTAQNVLTRISVSARSTEGGSGRPGLETKSTPLDRSKNRRREGMSVLKETEASRRQLGSQSMAPSASADKLDSMPNF